MDLHFKTFKYCGPQLNRFAIKCHGLTSFLTSKLPSQVVDIQPPEGNSEPSVKASGKMTLDDGAWDDVTRICMFGVPDLGPDIC